MTPLELHRLAAAVATLRPDWPAASLQTFLERNLAYRPLRDAAIALIACALDPATTTPARVLEPGPWWQAASTRDIPTARNTCSRHEHAGLRLDQTTGETQCAGCWADSVAVTTPPDPRPDHPIPPDVRAQLLAVVGGPERAARPERAQPQPDQLEET